VRLEKADLHAMLDQAIRASIARKSGAAASVTVFKNYSPDVPPVRMEAELIEHVITNLLRMPRRPVPRARW
jgi:nitrogen-specific signal transduction histidine kinase